MVEKARSRALSLRALAREPGIARNAASRYARAASARVFGERPAQGNGDRALTESLMSSP